MTGKQVVEEQVRLILKELDWVYHRPKEGLAAKRDKSARWGAEKFLDEKKRAYFTNDFQLFFVDETTISLLFPFRPVG